MIILISMSIFTHGYCYIYQLEKHMYICMYVYVCMYMYVCICVMNECVGIAYLESNSSSNKVVCISGESGTICCSIAAGPCIPAYDCGHSACPL